MKYAGTYYSKLKLFSKTRCNLNYLCWDIEKWEKNIRFKRKSPDTSDLMMNKDLDWYEDEYAKVEKVFKEFNKEMALLGKQSYMAKRYNNFKDFFEGYSKAEVQNTDINWDLVYDRYNNVLSELKIPEERVANYAVHLNYVKYAKGSKNFCWSVTGDGLIKNLKSNKESNIKFPVETGDFNDREYLGKYYKMEESEDV